MQLTNKRVLLCSNLIDDSLQLYDTAVAGALEPPCWHFRKLLMNTDAPAPMIDSEALPGDDRGFGSAAPAPSAIPDEIIHLKEAWRWVSTRAWVWRVLIYLLLVAPLFVSGPLPSFPLPLNVVWPRIHSGDEPHYLVILSSLIQDGDLDLANNYNSVHAGGGDAGRSFAGQPLDHHVSWYDNGKYMLWWQVFEIEPGKWSRQPNGDPVPTLRADHLTTALPERQYSWHPPGIAILLAIPTYPFRGTGGVESVALICTALTVVLACFFFEKLITPFVNNWQQQLLVTGTVFLGTPIWHYGRTLFNEPYLLCFSLAAYALALRYNRYVAAGTCIALGIWMKPPFALLAIPLAMNCVIKKQYFAVFRLFSPLAVAVALLLWMNQQMHGSVGASSTAWQWGNPIAGSFKLFFSIEHGILMYSPIVVVAFVCLPQFFTKRFPESANFGSAFILYFLLMVSWVSWHGGYCFGPRMVIPVLPFLLLPLCGFFDSDYATKLLGSKTVPILAVISIAINAIGAFGCGWIWNRHPVEFIGRWIVSSS